MISIFEADVIRGAFLTKQRTGQYLFNCLPNEVANVVAGSLFDPFHKDLSSYEIRAWINEHLVFSDSGAIIGVFNKDDILWEGIAVGPVV